MKIIFFSKYSYQFHFTDVIVSLHTTVNMPMVLVGAPENTTVVVSLLMVHRLASIPIKLVASFVGESPAPSVGVRVQTVVQSKPGTRFN